MDDGKYAYSNMELICKCGHKLGYHAAASSKEFGRPCWVQDDFPDINCTCERFIKAKTTYDPQD